MKQATEMIEAILEQRFGAMDAQALKFGRARLIKKEIQFMDVKHMSELCERYRGRLRRVVGEYRHWQGVHAVENDPVERLYGAVEGTALHRQVSDALKIWYFAHRDYHAMRKIYLRQCMGPDARVSWERAGGKAA